MKAVWDLSHFTHPPRTRPESETVLEWQRPMRCAQVPRSISHPQPRGMGRGFFGSPKT
jgi:hypothetical protein